MKYIDEYKNAELVQKLLKEINHLSKNYGQEMVFMEVCGTHTMAIFRSGLKKLFPRNLRLLSGPGCPVCVTPNDYLDKSIAYAQEEDVVITTFGDLVRVPGSHSSLEKEKTAGCNVLVVYSSLDALEVAQDNPGKKIIFLGVGFETTAPTLAVTIKIAKEKNIKNFFVFSGHKLIPPAMKALIQSQDLGIHGFICPGHVSAIIGSSPYEFIAREYKIPCVISGFEPLDIVQAIYMLVRQITTSCPEVEIQYTRTVKKQGNLKALNLMREIFQPVDSKWRGLGNIPDSGLKIRPFYEQFDAEYNIKVDIEESPENGGCICGEVLRGFKTPLDCPLFKETCTPQTPRGACMVSSEGTCSAYYKYGE